MTRDRAVARPGSRAAACLLVAVLALALGACTSKKHKVPVAGPAPAVSTAAGAPHKGKPATPMQPENMPYRMIDGQPLVAYLFAPAKLPKNAPPAPAILLFHPGGWEEGSATWNFDDARRFANQGFVAIAIEYRLANDKRTPVAAFEDACAAFAWVRTHAIALHVDPKRVAGYGDSAGGQLVAATGTIACPAAIGDRAATRPDLMLLVSPVLDTVNDPYAQLLHARARAVDYSPLAHAGAGAPPTLIVQGDADTRTPTATAQAFCDKLHAAHVDCRLDSFEGVGHLLTRDLKDQEGDIDPDPRMLADSQRHEREFLLSHQFVPVPPVPKTRHLPKDSKATLP
ncbi:MAG TPA: alpha/beta hydrolase [Xanthomonadaceae bacterium]|jgi:acetyl esterase/lipase